MNPIELPEDTEEVQVIQIRSDIVFSSNVERVYFCLECGRKLLLALQMKKPRVFNFRFLGCAEVGSSHPLWTCPVCWAVYSSVEEAEGQKNLLISTKQQKDLALQKIKEQEEKLHTVQVARERAKAIEETKKQNAEALAKEKEQAAEEAFFAKTKPLAVFIPTIDEPEREETMSTYREEYSATVETALVKPKLKWWERLILWLCGTKKR